MPRLERGDELPSIVVPSPGPETRRLARRLADYEAPGINTLDRDGGTEMVWLEALGANVLDVDGNRYLDLTSGFGVAAVGHRHPRVGSAIADQGERLLHGLADVYAHPSRVELAARLCALSPVAEGRVYFAVSGADAVEIALKSAVLATGRQAVLTFDPAYHGLTLGALAASSRTAFREPFASLLNPHIHRLPYAAPIPTIENLLQRQSEIGAVLVEPIAGREGVLIPPAGWLHDLAELVQSRGLLLIADEIFTGFARTGRLFAVDHEAVRPDLLCCGKALGGGLPIAAVVGRREVLRAWSTSGEPLHTATFVAHPLACAAALAVLELIEEEGLAERAECLGRRVAERLAPLARGPGVRALRGRGLLFAVETESAPLAKAWAAAARRNGVLVLAGGENGRVVQLVPPLTITEPQLECALELLTVALAEARSGRHPS